MNDFLRAKKFIASHDWHFAKSMAYIPHWYCLRADQKDYDRFLWFTRFIRENSIDGSFYGRKFRYFYLNGYKYWDMDDRAEDCDLINRDRYKTDFISDEAYSAYNYDMFYQQAVSDIIVPRMKDNAVIADLYCGAGEFIHWTGYHEGYRGIDTRRSFLKEFAKTDFEYAKGRLYLEKVSNLSYEGVDMIVSLNAQLFDRNDVRRILASRKTDAGVFLFSKCKLAPLEGFNLIESNEFSLITNETI